MDNFLYQFIFLCRLNLLLIISTLFLLSGCLPQQVDFEAGWTTRKIQGTILNENSRGPVDDSFILVLEYFTRFVQVNDKQILYIPRAKLIWPESGGNYQIHFDLRASAIETVFIAANHQMERLQFKRQMGIGELHYEAKMKPVESWREHFILEISPFLENFILEPRYKLAPTHQLFLGEWMSRQRALIEQRELTTEST